MPPAPATSPIDYGVGPGWIISAGPAGDATKVPLALQRVQSGASDEVILYYADGDRQAYPHFGGLYYRQSGSGSSVIRHDPDSSPETWTFRTPTGGKFTFSGNGTDPGGATLSSASPGSASFGSTGFDYTFANDTGTSLPQLQSVTDPAGRTVTFDWITNPAPGAGTGGRTAKILHAINAWGSRTWTLHYTTIGSESRLTSIDHPDGNTVEFDYGTYAGTTLLDTITDGEQRLSGGQTDIRYATTAPTRVISVKDGEVANASTFAYSAVLNGEIVTRTTVTDPKGTATPAAGDYQTYTDFNTMGLPVQVYRAGVTEAAGTVQYQTKMVWDTNGNLLCSRTPQAVQENASECSTTDLTDERNTEYSYSSSLLLSKRTDPRGTNDAVRTSSEYKYDDTNGTGTDGSGLPGLHQEVYSNRNLAGRPHNEHVAPTVDLSAAPEGGLGGSWSVRYSGFLYIPSLDFYDLRLLTNDGGRLIIDGEMLVDCWSEHTVVMYNCGTSSTSDMMRLLSQGRHSITVEFFDDTADAVRLSLQWIPPWSSNWAAIPGSNFRLDLNLLTSVTDQSNTSTNYSYATENYKLRRLPSSVSRGNRSTTYTYDSFGRVSTSTNAHGDQVANTWDTDSSCLFTRVDGAGAETDYTCDTADNVTQVKQILRNVPETAVDEGLTGPRLIDTTYDGLGRVLTQTVPHLASELTPPKTTNVYDGAGRISQVTDPMGFVTSYHYDKQGRLTKETLPDPDGAGPAASPTIEHTYDDNGNETQTKDVHGKTTTRTFDAMNRLFTQTDPAGVITTVTYSLADRQKTVTTGGVSGVKTVTEVDFLGRVAWEKVGNLSPTFYFYDDNGLLESVSGPAPALPAVDPAVNVSYTYNVFGEIASETRDTGSGASPSKTASRSYDNAGRLVNVTRFDGVQETYGYDGDGRLTSTTVPVETGHSITSRVNYDDLGERVRTTTDSLGQDRVFGFDARGHQASFSDADGNATTFSYNADGWLKKVACGSLERNFTYDNLGRITQRTGAGGIDNEMFTYDDPNNTFTASNVNGTVTIDYDNAGRLNTVSWGTAVSSSYSYLPATGQLATRTDNTANAGALTTTFTYRPGDGLVDTVSEPLGPSTLTYTYDSATGALAQVANSGGLTTTFSYDAAARLKAKTTVQGSNNLAAFTVGYDSMSNVTSLDQNVAGYTAKDNGAWSYVYDWAGRLTSAKDPAGTNTTYGFDDAGNRTRVQVGSAPKTSTVYDAAGYPSYDFVGANTAHSRDYTVDPWGRLNKIAIGNVVKSFRYDTWDRLASLAITQSVSSGGPSVPPTYAYTYDALGRQLTRLLANRVDSTFSYVGPTEHPSELVTNITSKPITTDLTYSTDGPVTQKLNLGSNNIRTTYALTSPHGDVVGLIDKASLAAASATAYGPWGERRTSSGLSSALGYQADLTDPGTGLVDMGTRLYDPAQGRFQTKDVLFGNPSRPGSLNQFIYGEDNPTTFTDPTGMGIQCENSGGSGSDFSNGQCSTKSEDTDQPTTDGGNGNGGGNGDGGSHPHHTDTGSGGAGDSNNDIFQHGHGQANAPVPIWHGHGWVLQTIDFAVLWAVQQVFHDATDQQIESVVSGLRTQVGRGRITVTGYQSRTNRAGPQGESNGCRGQLGCFNVIVGQDRIAVPARGSAGCSLLCNFRKAASMVSLVAAGVAVAGATMAFLGFSGLAWATIGLVAGGVSVAASIGSSVAECIERGWLRASCARSWAGTGVNVVSFGLGPRVAGLMRVATDVAGFGASLSVYLNANE